MEVPSTSHNSHLASELYFLITRFLSGGPCVKTLEVLKEELEKNHLLPCRYDWLGNKYDQSYEQLALQYPHVGSDHLLAICQRICPILDKEYPPSLPGITSLLGSNRQSLLRCKSVPKRPCVRRYSVRFHGLPPADPSDFQSTHNIVQVLEGRRNAGPIRRRQAITSKLYSHMQLHNRTLGHLSAVYCLLFDQTGQLVFTGADDLLVKVWSTQSGRLLSTLRGASSEITDMAVNVENTLLAAGSIDRVLRVWCLQTTAPVAALVNQHGMITGVNFCPGARGDFRYLTSTSSDGSVAFWVYTFHPIGRNTVFQEKPFSYVERIRPGAAQMICASFSPGGTFLVAGSGDHHVRIYLMTGGEGPTRIVEIEAHSDRVDSIQWANNGLKFVSGSKDGTAIVWQYRRQKWSTLMLDMSSQLPGTVLSEEDQKLKAKVSMVCWNKSDKWIVTAVHDSTLKVWDSITGKLVQVLKAHKDEVFVLESHPHDQNIMLSAGHDGLICVWDLARGIVLMQHQNTIEGQGHGAVFDAKWSPDGNMFAATDSHGHILVFGFGPESDKLRKLPKELFFHTDYRPLIRDSNHGVLDEQTLTAPHLMPPPFLVDADGCPYPPNLQRLVPGREECKVAQLVPNVAYGTEGEQEVVEGLPNEQPRIDHMIQALVNRQYGQPNARQQPASSRPAPRRNESGVVRFNDGVWEGDTSWKTRTLLRPMQQNTIEQTRLKLDAIAAVEMEEYERESKLPEETPPKAPKVEVKPKRKTRRNRGAYQTRATTEENEFEHPDNLELSASTSVSVASTSDSMADSDDMDSEYSDWIADHGVSLEPPKRSKRKRVPRNVSPSPTPPPRRRNIKENKEIKEIKETKEVSIPSNLTLKELPSEFLPPKWLTEVIPRKAPYYPQMGDEVMFFKQGYHLYLEAVKRNQAYQVAARQGFKKLTEPCYMKVVGIKYEIKPPRLCCLRLVLLNDSGSMTEQFIKIKYHDMPDVIDFLVLKQTYDIAMQRHWKPGDRFRCMIEDAWWEGEIVSTSPHSPDYPDSPFLCYKTRWDNGEDEPMSPWDMEPPDETRHPVERGASMPVLPEETQALLYCPTSDEWPNGDQDATCRRIIAGLNKVMELAIAEPFNAPVDLNLYPDYAMAVEYPVDLSIIRARLENRFYRRLTAVQFDVRFLATNAEQYNQAHSQIVKQARIVTDLCLRIISDRVETNVGAVYHQLTDTYISSPSENESDEIDIENPGPSRRRAVDWVGSCKRLLQKIVENKDSEPFREPVNTIMYPDYLQRVECPMDLGTVREELEAGNYAAPRDFYKDMRLIFANSSKYNSETSSIYEITVALSEMFESKMDGIMKQWKAARRKTLFDNIRNVSKRERDINQPGPSKQSSSESDIESEDPVDEHLKLSTLRNNYLKQNAAQLNGHSYAKPNHSSKQALLPNSRKKAADSEASDSSDGSGSEDSYKPNGHVRTRNRGRRKVASRSPSEESSDESIDSNNSNNTDNSDDSSDSSPLAARRSVGKRKRVVNKSDSETSVLPRTRSRKMPRRVQTYSDHSQSESGDEEESPVTGRGAYPQVSSRGRRRKFTEKDDRRETKAWKPFNMYLGFPLAQ